MKLEAADAEAYKLLAEALGVAKALSVINEGSGERLPPLLTMPLGILIYSHSVCFVIVTYSDKETRTKFLTAKSIHSLVPVVE